MKYHININQQALSQHGLLGRLDIVDLAIFDFIYDFFNSECEGKVTFVKDGCQYVEIRCALIQQQLPILNISSKRTFQNRMNNLIDAGLIERYENNQTENRSAFRKGVNWDIFKFDTPTKKISHPYEKNFAPPTKKISHNNNINNNNIIYNNIPPTPKTNEDDYYDKNLNIETVSPLDFREVWQTYPVGNPFQAEIEWNKLPTEEKIEALNFIPSYLAETPRQYIKNFQNFIKEKHWLTKKIINHGQEQQSSNTSSKESYSNLNRIAESIFGE